MIGGLVKTPLKAAANLALRVWGRMNAANYDIRRTIVLACSSRGGSTWLAEIISTLPGCVMINEPLYQSRVLECRRHGFEWHTFIPPGAEEPFKRRYLLDILSGRNLYSGLLWLRRLRCGQFKSCLRLQGYLVKFCRANLFCFGPGSMRPPFG